MVKRSRAILALLVLAFTAALAVRVPDPVFTERPQVEGVWVVEKPSGNVIGDVIVVTLYLTHPRGVYFPLSDLPDVGYSLDRLAEVRKWTVSRSDFFSSIQSGQVVTEVRYELQYLVPIDFNQPETKVVGPSRQIIFKYLLQDNGKIDLKHDAVFVLGFDYFIVRRVDDGSRPYGVLKQQWPVPMQWGWMIQALGVVILLLATVLYLWRRIRSGRKAQVARPVESQPVGTIRELYQMWCTSGDYRFFKEAVRLYRKPFFTKVMAGKVTPPADWEETSFILYSGEMLDSSKVEEIFQRMMGEEDNGRVASCSPSIASRRQDNV